MYIVHVATELAPVAKVGGLGDVVHGLAKEFIRNGNKVEIILPKYDSIDFSQLKNLKVEQREIWSVEGPYKYNNTIWSAQTDGLTVYLLEPHHPNFYFSRGTIYGTHDDLERFTYFSRAALEFLYKTKRQPDAIHLHDWPAALIAPLYKEIYAPLKYSVGGIVLTIHNLEHQGKCLPSMVTRMGLRGEAFLTPDKMQDLYYPNLLNLLKGGIVYADAITTVSPNYEKEIKTAEGGFGLQSTLIKHQKKLKGILNGIDEEYWNPEKDPHLVKHYPSRPIDSSIKLEKVLQNKAENKRQIRVHFGLKEERVPLCACITRLVTQKGPELIKHAVARTLEKGGQFVLLGSVPSPAVEKEFKDLQKHYAKNKNFALYLDRDEALAHLLYAGSDMLIIPSLFEPCGLTQLIALRYGSVPIARMTGGLVDTVFDVDTSKIQENLRNGFTFEFPDAQGVNWALDRALDCWKDRKRWQKIMTSGMNYNFSWAKSAAEYLEIYKKIGKKTETQTKLKNLLAVKAK